MKTIKYKWTSANMIENSVNALCDRCFDSLQRHIAKDNKRTNTYKHINGIDLNSDTCQMCKKSIVVFGSKYALCSSCKKKPKYIIEPYLKPDLNRYLERLKKFEMKYGIDFFKDFESLRKNPYTKLGWVGNKYGISIERVRQLFRVFYGVPYTEAVDKCSIAMKEGNVTNCHKDPRVNVATKEYLGERPRRYKKIEKLFYDKCEELSLSIKPNCKISVDCIVNGKKVDIKSTRRAKRFSKKGNIKYFAYSVSKKQIEICDFLACYNPRNKSFFIIPINEFRKNIKNYNNIKCNKHIYIPDRITNYISSKNNYIEYENAWHLLHDR